MNSKLFEVRDRNTLLVVVATRLSPDDDRCRWLLSWAGFGKNAEAQRRYILVSSINGGGTHPQSCDPYLGDITTRTVHRYLEDHWDDCNSGDLLDAEFLRGETASPKQSDYRPQPVGEPAF
jgi:hypothetical protein